MFHLDLFKYSGGINRRAFYKKIIAKYKKKRNRKNIISLRFIVLSFVDV